MVFIATRLRSRHLMDLQWFWSENSSYSVATEVFCCSISINMVLHMMCWLCRWWSSVCSQYVICVVGAGRHWNSNACTERLQSDGESSWFTLQSSQLRITTDGQDWSCVQGTVAGSITTAVIDWLCVCALQIALCLYWSIILFMLTVFLRVMSAITSHIFSAGCLPWWCNDYNVRITISRSPPVWTPVIPLSHDDFGSVVHIHTHVPVSSRRLLLLLLTDVESFTMWRIAITDAVLLGR